MNQDKFKTPLHYYEIAITELAKAREELQSELKELKILKSSYQALDAELKTNHSNIERLEQELQEAKREVTNHKSKTEKGQERLAKISEEQKEAFFQKMNHLEGELQSAREKIKNNTQDIKELKERMIFLTDSGKSNSKFVSLEQELELIKKELAKTKQEFKGLQERLIFVESKSNENKFEIKQLKASTQPITIQSGVFSGNIKKTEGWNNNLYGKQGQGRIFKEKISFEKPFISSPQVVLGISYADVQKGANHRLRVLSKNITVNGFDLEIHTWLDTQVWGADVNWLAYGH